MQAEYFSRTSNLGSIAETILTRQQIDLLLHHHIIRAFIHEGYAPTNEQLAQKVASSVHDVEAGLLRLQASHGVVTIALKHIPSLQVTHHALCARTA